MSAANSNVIKANTNSGLRIRLNTFLKVLLVVCRLLAITKLKLKYLQAIKNVKMFREPCFAILMSKHVLFYSQLFQSLLAEISMARLSLLEKNTKIHHPKGVSIQIFRVS